MNISLQVLCISASLLVTLIVIHLIRLRRLREDYALLWLVSGMSLLLLSFDRNILHRASALVGIAYPPSLLLLGVILMGFLLSMHFSMSLSRLSEENKRLAQDLAILRLEIERNSTQPPAASA